MQTLRQHIELAIPKGLTSDQLREDFISRTEEEVNRYLEHLMCKDRNLEQGILNYCAAVGFTTTIKDGIVLAVDEQTVWDFTVPTKQPVVWNK